MSHFSRDKLVSGVTVELPRLTRVVPVAHGSYGGSTLTFKEERQDYELVKLEAVPGVREVNPLLGAKVALPPRGAFAWDGEALLWRAREASPRSSSSSSSSAAAGDGGDDDDGDGRIL